ncbi:hypothetical protein AWQ22_10765 [Picosynechococcus sp. PCC 7117]|nr:hypothetical protein AWQ22_10765 [Picosynechococcus sp. PCC 7117]
MIKAKMIEGFLVSRLRRTVAEVARSIFSNDSSVIFNPTFFFIRHVFFLFEGFNKLAMGFSYLCYLYFYWFRRAKKISIKKQ